MSSIKILTGLTGAMLILVAASPAVATEHRDPIHWSEFTLSYDPPGIPVIGTCCGRTDDGLWGLEGGHGVPDPWPGRSAACENCAYTPCPTCADDPATPTVDETGRMYYEYATDPVNHSYEILYGENIPHSGQLYLVTDINVGEDLTANPLELSLEVENGTYNVWILNWYQHLATEKYMEVTIEGITATAAAIPGDMPVLPNLYNALFFNFEIGNFEVSDGEINIVLGQPEGEPGVADRHGTQVISFTGFDVTKVDPVATPGDIDGDGDVDFTDFSILAGNFTGTLDPGTGGKTRDEGDFDGDADVDFGDFSSLAGNFTGTITAPAGDAPTEGEVHLEIDLTNDGAMTLEPNNADLAGYSIRSPDSQLVPDADGAAAPFMFYLLNAAQEVTAGSVGATTALAADLALDISFAGDANQAANVVFQYTRAGEVTPVDGIVHVTPEPTTMMLLAAGGLLVLPCRRRRCA